MMQACITANTHSAWEMRVCMLYMWLRCTKGLYRKGNGNMELCERQYYMWIRWRVSSVFVLCWPLVNGLIVCAMDNHLAHRIRIRAPISQAAYTLLSAMVAVLALNYHTIHAHCCCSMHIFLRVWFSHVFYVCCVFCVSPVWLRMPAQYPLAHQLQYQFRTIPRVALQYTPNWIIYLAGLRWRNGRATCVLCAPSGIELPRFSGVCWFRCARVISRMEHVNRYKETLVHFFSARKFCEFELMRKCEIIKMTTTDKNQNQTNEFERRTHPLCLQSSIRRALSVEVPKQLPRSRNPSYPYGIIMENKPTKNLHIYRYKK